MHIIVKKNSESKRFKPHYNSSMGKYYHTKNDYLGDMKKHDLEPFREVKRDAPKPYKPSQWAHSMANAIQRRTEKDGSVCLSTDMVDQLNGKLKTKFDPSKLDPKKGGFAKE